MLTNPIRDIRESKNLSQDTVAAECGLTYSVYYRIEQGSGKTTQAEVDKVLKVLKKLKPGTRKIAGRPFGDAKLQAKIQAARESGASVAEVLASAVPAQKAAAPAAKKTAAPAKATTAKKTAAPAKANGKTTAKKTTAKKTAASKQAESLI